MFENRNTYSSQYLPWAHTFRNAYESKGKRAITGTLRDPYQYKSHRSQMRLRGYASKNAVMAGVDDGEEETVLFMDQVDEALQGRVAGLDVDVVFNSSVLSEPAIQLVTARDEQEGISIRTNLKPTGLFEYLVTDEDGMGTYRFRAQKLLNLLKIQGISFHDLFS